MPRSLLYVSAAIVVLCLVVTTLRVTSRASNSPPCKHCGASHATLTHSGKGYCLYVCRSCGATFEGPERADFSWAGAIRVMLQDAGYVE